MDTPPTLSVHTKVCLLAVLNAALCSAGGAFQRLNGLRGGHPVWGGWLVASAACLLPTFFIGSLAFSIGGKLSLFFPVTAIGYLFTQLVAQIAFRERTDAVSWLGVCLIVAGVVISAWPR